MTTRVYGVDLGTSVIKIYRKGKGVIVDQKNMIAIENKKKVRAIGDEAYEMYEKAPENVDVSYPIKKGVIAEIAYMEALFNCFLKRVYKGGKALPSDYIVAIPTDITDVERRAFSDLIESSNARAKSVKMVEKPIVAALGADLDITNARGVMMVDIGASTTEISVLSLGGIVISKLLPVGGNALDEAIAANVKKTCNLYIGNRTAEILKKELGCAFPQEEYEKKVYGRNIVTGLPQQLPISSLLVYDAIREYLNAIVEAVKMILEKTPPEISADIIDSGIYISGGSAKIKDLDKLIESETELKVNVCENPSNAVVKGIGRIIEDPSLTSLAFDCRVMMGRR